MLYLDNIIIWLQTVEEHEQNVAKVLDALRAAKLFCNKNKSVLFATEIFSLGHIISGSGISADPRKTDWIINWPQPQTSTNVHGFLGLTRYLSAFLPALAEHTAILTPLTNKECDKDFPEWMNSHQAAFDAIKRLVTGVDCLTVIDYNDPNKHVFLTMDASDRRTGAILSFSNSWETACPVAYDSYQLNPAEKNYPVHEKELLAIVKARNGGGASLAFPSKSIPTTAHWSISNHRRTCQGVNCAGQCSWQTSIMKLYTSMGRITQLRMPSLECLTTRPHHYWPPVPYHIHAPPKMNDSSQQPALVSQPIEISSHLSRRAA